jgi:phage tail-like protein
MPTRERPYSVFNFLVKLGDDANPAAVEAGFQEVSGLGIEITVQEYRSGNSKENTPQKIAGMHKVADVTLKRGVMGASDLYRWIDQVRSGDQNGRRTVVIQLMNEEHTAVAAEWKLGRAQLTKYTGPAFNGKGTDVAVEEMVIAAESIDFVYL